MKKVLLTILLLLLESIIINQSFTSQAYAESLYVRTDKSYVKPGSSYKLTILSSRTPFTGYNGLLDVKVENCTESGVCNTTIGPWGNYYVQGGSIKIDIPENFPRSYFRARFRPRGSNWDWSNEIQINVGITTGLENTQEYWLIPQDKPIEYVGSNFTDGKEFKTVIGYKSPIQLCGETVYPMYFMKNNQSGYWDPHTPWYDDIRVAGYDTKNLIWYIAPWQNKESWASSGYDDEYLTSIGHITYNYNPNDPFNLENNFQPSRAVAQYRYQFPNYLISPKWVGAGWGIGTQAKSSGLHSAQKPFCEILPNTSGPGTWAVHANVINLELPNYKGPALQYKFYEGGHNFVSDRTKWGLREDWYFVKNHGLIKIEAKYFGPDSRIKTCQEDEDCLINEVMSSPHIRLVRSNISSFTGGDLNNDNRVDIFDYNILVTNFGKTGDAGWIPADINKDGKVDIFDYNILVSNFHK